MCGIAGFLNLNNAPTSEVVLKKMTDAIAHRGPDGAGYYNNEAIALGHRRLAIIDLTPAGHQPMRSQNDRFIITYNGEVYNFVELRNELESLGYRFLSRTDSEVVLNAFVEWGGSCVSRFNGMFAFAIWDNLKKELFLARDRYGIKPLYYSLQANTFIFASEYKAIIQHPVVERKIDKEALLEYFTFQNLFTDKTLLQNIHLLPAGCSAKISIADNKINVIRYWDYKFTDSEGGLTEEESREELDRLFIQAVKRQLVTDVEIGAYLSGGLDSGSITAVAARHCPYIKSFTCGFDLRSASGLELGFDEREKAEYMSYVFKTEHYEMVLKAGDMERIMPKLAWHIEDPRVGQSYPNYYAAQLASKFVKVVLSGAGGDEFFAGYPWRYYRAAVNDSFDHYIDKYYQFWQRLIPNSYLEKIFSPIKSDVQHVWTKDIFRNVFSAHESALERPEDCINHSLYFEAKTFLHGLLVVEDKLSMAHGLETRVPFLDNDLVDFAMKMPVRFKLNNLQEVIKINENDPGQKGKLYFERTKDGKRILRDVMQRYVPQAITSSVKQGFSAPDSTWFRGESIDYVRDTLCSKQARIYNYFDRSAVDETLSEHFEGHNNRRLFIWSLLSLEHFLENYLS